jgi:hypothetical protein
MQKLRIKVHQKPDTFTRDTQVGQKLCLKQRVEPFNTFDFHDNGVFHQKVESVFTKALGFVEAGTRTSRS